MSVELAFYRGAGRLDDRLVRWATRSEFSHVELVWERAGGSTGNAISASGRDGGVRAKAIEFHPDRWSFVELLPWAPLRGLRPAAEALIGAPYDYAGILLTFAVPIRRHTIGAYTCSEFCAELLGLEEPHLYSPGDLWRVARALNGAFEGGAMGTATC
ncbi:MAG: hypothetical protein ACU0CO_12780 [Shimia sp.]